MSQNRKTIPPLGADVTRYLNALATLAGVPPEHIVEQALWDYLPTLKETTLERRRKIAEFEAYVSSVKPNDKTGAK
jgi:hypothetical protein